VTLGPGKYDQLATHVREQAQALGVVVIVLDGARGSGFSVQAPPAAIMRLPLLLRSLADSIEADGPLS
jgi:predicted component of type VI protein secretion system